MAKGKGAYKSPRSTERKGASGGASGATRVSSGNPGSFAKRVKPAFGAGGGGKHGSKY